MPTRTVGVCGMVLGGKMSKPLKPAEMDLKFWVTVGLMAFMFCGCVVYEAAEDAVDTVGSAYSRLRSVRWR